MYLTSNSLVSFVGCGGSTIVQRDEVLHHIQYMAAQGALNFEGWSPLIIERVAQKTPNVVFI